MRKSSPAQYFSVGQKVKIIEGPFKGLSGALTDVRNSKRLILSITLLQRSVYVEVDGAAILPIDQPYFIQSLSHAREQQKTQSSTADE